MGDFSHLSKTGEAGMVDVSGKEITSREAVVSGRVSVSSQCAELLDDRKVEGIRSCAAIAGIQAAKQTAGLIPMCHQIPLAKVDCQIDWRRDEKFFSVRVHTKTRSETGVEMEALTAAVVCGATIYDMIKSVDPAAVVGPFHLERKSGGKLGLWER
jgi:cyclic pyranopterin phosphate synthase